MDVDINAINERISSVDLSSDTDPVHVFQTDSSQDTEETGQDRWSSGGGGGICDERKDAVNDVATTSEQSGIDIRNFNCEREREIMYADKIDDGRERKIYMVQNGQDNVTKVVPTFPQLVDYDYSSGSREDWDAEIEEEEEQRKKKAAEDAEIKEEEERKSAEVLDDTRNIEIARDIHGAPVCTQALNERASGEDSETDTRNNGPLRSSFIASQQSESDCVNKHVSLKSSEDDGSIDGVPMSMDIVHRKDDDEGRRMNDRYGGTSSKKKKKKHEKLKPHRRRHQIDPIDEVTGALSKASTGQGNEASPRHVADRDAMDCNTSRTSITGDEDNRVSHRHKKRRQDRADGSYTHESTPTSSKHVYRNSPEHYVGSPSVRESRTPTSAITGSHRSRQHRTYSPNSRHVDPYVTEERTPTGRTERRLLHKPREPTYTDDDSPAKRPGDLSAGTEEHWKFRPPLDFIGVAGKDNKLSNFYYCNLYVYGIDFWSTEQAYQWRKAMIMGNEEAASEIYDAEYAGTAKRLANKYFQGCNLDKWIAVRIPVMRQLLRAKARCCRPFREEIRTSGSRVIAEVVKGDHVWGIGDGTGENILGRLLMELRENLDDATKADPEEDGKQRDHQREDNCMLPFPLLPSAPGTPRQHILLITTTELDDVNWTNVIPNSNINKFGVASIDEAVRYVHDEDLQMYDTIALHILSRQTMYGSIEEMVDSMKELITEIKEKMKDPKICLSLPISSSDFSTGTTHNRSCDLLSGRLSQMYSRYGSVVCVQPNKLSISSDECYTEGGAMSSRALSMLTYNLLRLIYYRVSTQGSYNQDRRGDKRHRSAERGQSRRSFNHTPRQTDMDSSLNDSCQASPARYPSPRGETPRGDIPGEVMKPCMPRDRNDTGVSHKQHTPLDRNYVGVGHKQHTPLDRNDTGVSHKQHTPLDRNDTGVGHKPHTPLDRNDTGVGHKPHSPSPRPMRFDRRASDGNHGNSNLTYDPRGKSNSPQGPHTTDNKSPSTSETTGQSSRKYESRKGSRIQGGFANWNQNK